MKKPYIYAAVLSALLIFGALAAVYQINHPGRIIPSKVYTERKAELITKDYRTAAEQLGIENNKRGSTVYAVMAEVSLPELEKEYGITSAFYFLDVEEKRAHVYSNGAEADTTQEKIVLLGVTEAATEFFDDSFTLASNTDYGIPDYGYVKLYFRRGDGVYFKLYKEDEIPKKFGMVFDMASSVSN